MSIIKIQLADIPTKSKTPILTYCRKLVADGVDANKTLHVCRGDVLAVKVRTIGEWATLTVKENDHVGPIFVPYKPSPFSSESPEILLQVPLGCIL
jgi:hypothetical protein